MLLMLHSGLFYIYWYKTLLHNLNGIKLCILDEVLLAETLKYGKIIAC